MNNQHHQEIENLARNIKWIRTSNGLSKKAMAAIMGIGVGSLTKLENGMLPPRADVKILFRLQDYFEIQVTDLFAKRLDEIGKLRQR